ncbi:hypothetical protein OKA06_14050 [Novosphingobium sp. MW5]|nr:hypothetical protein [Novosphingobium sp. MW5]
MRAFLKKPLVIATLVACLFGLLKLGQPIDHMYWNTRFRAARVEAPQSIIVVSTKRVDGQSALSDGAVANLLDGIESQAPKAIYFDRPVNFGAESATAAKIRELGSKVAVVASAREH